MSFEAGAFTGGYVNLEEPCVRREHGVDTNDLVLDIVVSSGRGWEWKDVDEFDGRIGDPLYFDTATAEAVRSCG